MKRYRRLRRLEPDGELLRRRAVGETFRELAPDYGVAQTTLSRFFARPDVTRQLRQVKQGLRAEQRVAEARFRAEQRAKQEARRRAEQQQAAEAGSAAPRARATAAERASPPSDPGGAGRLVAIGGNRGRGRAYGRYGDRGPANITASAAFAAGLIRLQSPDGSMHRWAEPFEADALRAAGWLPA